MAASYLIVQSKGLEEKKVGGIKGGKLLLGYFTLKGFGSPEKDRGFVGVVVMVVSQR